MKITFKIEGEYIELIKLLKATGLCSSGGMAKTVTTEGHVKVNKHIEYRKRCKLKKGHLVEFDGNIVKLE
jgi:ribosome-associated protein